jgi:hypothetical protein
MMAQLNESALGAAASEAAPKTGWDQWKAELEAVVERLNPGCYGPRGPIAECGEECWRQMFDGGYTPEEAFLEDVSCWG